MGLYLVEAVIRSEIPKGYKIKVSILESGIYIDGFRAYPSKRNPNEWFITPPSQKVGLKYYPIVEFAKSKPLWQEIVEACEQAIQDYKSNEPEYLPSDKEMSVGELWKGLDNADVG